MSLKAKLEAIIYAAEEPVTLEQLLPLVKDDLLAILFPVATQGEPEVQEASEGAVVPTATEAIQESEPVEPEQPESLQPGLVQHGSVQSGSLQPTIEGETHPSAEAASPDSDPNLAKKREKAANKALLEALHIRVEELIQEYANSDRGMEIRSVAGGYRMSTKPEHHDVVRAFAKSLKPPLRLSLPALETLAVIAYKQPATAPEISDIRGVDSSGVLAGLLDRKLITTAGRKQVIGRPILYKTTKEFLLRFGLKEIAELPSMEEFEKMTSSQVDLFPDMRDTAVADATGVPDQQNDQSEHSQSDEKLDTNAAETASEPWTADSQASGAAVQQSQSETPEDADSSMPEAKEA